MTPNRSWKSGRRRAALAVALAAAAVLGSACGGGGNKTAAGAALTTTSTGAATTATAKAAATEIAIKGFMFQPNPVHVTVGTTVTWTNQDEILHTVTAGTRTYDDQHLQKEIVPGPPGFDFQLDGKGKTATFTFSQTGTFNYLCSRHPGMDAQIVVS
ncbi:MAG: hypothetical protein QOI86_3987 [Actinomycetota bacterium]|nr:hypothetical protein [Actinomycetota bacterium]